MSRISSPALTATRALTRRALAKLAQGGVLTATSLTPAWSQAQMSEECEPLGEAFWQMAVEARGKQAAGYAFTMAPGLDRDRASLEQGCLRIYFQAVSTADEADQAVRRALRAACQAAGLTVWSLRDGTAVVSAAKTRLMREARA